MKKMMLLNVIIASSIFASCATNKQITTTQNNETETSEDTYQKVTENVWVTDTEQESPSTASGNGIEMDSVQVRTSISETNTFDYESMFNRLQMDQNQIREFKMAMEKFKNERDNSVSGEVMGTIEDERNRQLTSILTPKQLEIYRSMN